MFLVRSFAGLTNVSGGLEKGPQGEVDTSVAHQLTILANELWQAQHAGATINYNAIIDILQGGSGDGKDILIKPEKESGITTVLNGFEKIFAENAANLTYEQGMAIKSQLDIWRALFTQLDAAYYLDTNKLLQQLNDVVNLLKSKSVEITNVHAFLNSFKEAVSLGESPLLEGAFYEETSPSDSVEEEKPIEPVFVSLGELIIITIDGENYQVNRQDAYNARAISITTKQGKNILLGAQFNDMNPPALTNLFVLGQQELPHDQLCAAQKVDGNQLIQTLVEKDLPGSKSFWEAATHLDVYNNELRKKPDARLTEIDLIGPLTNIEILQPFNNNRDKAQQAFNDWVALGFLKMIVINKGEKAVNSYELTELGQGYFDAYNSNFLNDEPMVIGG